MKRFFSIVMVLVLCLAISVPAFATDSNANALAEASISPENNAGELAEAATPRSSGYGQGYGYAGSFNVYVPSGTSSGKVTIRITSPDQNQLVYFKVTDKNGRSVWDHSKFDTPGKMGVYPQNGAEIISPTFSNAIAGNYTVTFTSLVQVTVDCWVYNW